jgi:small nuclear ribonucleoprotein (snRNP)-like protein
LEAGPQHYEDVVGVHNLTKEENMNGWRKHTVIGLVTCLLQLSLIDVAFSADATVPNPSLTRQRVDQFGVGAIVKVELLSGKKVRGSIQSVEEGAFLVASSKVGPSTRVDYDQVAQLKLAKVTYKAKGQPDAVEVKRVAAGLGVGHHIMVKTAEAKEYHGNIVGLDAQSLTVLPDHASAPVEIAYNSVQQMGPNMSKGAKIAIIVVGGGIVAAWCIYAATHSD